VRHSAVALLLALLALPATAEAQLQDPTFRGVTGQGRDVTFALTDSGAPGSLVVEWDARCRHGTRFAVQETAFFSRVENPPPGIVDGVGRYRVAERRGRIARVTAVIRGRATGDPARPQTQRWSGTLRVRATMRRHGRLEDRCSLRTRWRAGPEGIGFGAWEMTGEVAGEAQPRLWRRDSGSAVVAARGTRDEVSVEADDPVDAAWTATFTAPALNRLEPGRTYTTGFEELPGAARMYVSGPSGSSCSSSSGSFTVELIAFDALKRLSALRVRFELRCSSYDTPRTVRGLIDWRAAG
jgi:hypothetical protein